MPVNDVMFMFGGDPSLHDPVYDPAEGSRKLPQKMEVGEPSEWVDYRQEELRVEGFLRYYGARRISHDLDHTHYYTTIAREHSLNFEQAAWFSLLFGMTYKVPQAHVYWYLFQNFHAFSGDDFEKWNAEHWRRTKYGTDARYNKGHFATQVASIKKWLDGATFEEKISPLMGGSEDENFEALFAEVQKLYKYGRMTSWLTLQALWDILKLPINARTVLVDNPANWSPYNGVMFLLSREDLIAGKHNKVAPGFRPSNENRQMAFDELEKIWVQLEKRYPDWTIDGYRLETALCQYKKLYTGWEYIGHASGDAAQSYVKASEEWPEVDFTALRDAFKDQPPKIAGCPRIPMLNTVFSRYGILLNEDLLGDGAASGFEILGIDPPTPMF